jgi:gamma-glutamylcyclotransferase (GGCT)/AIG2-like uncharacterized protein YtfP
MPAIFYFAYGSNMDPMQMQERDVHFKSREYACLMNYQLTFNKIAVGEKGKGYANIMPCPGINTEGALYQVTETGLMNLDTYENYPKEYNRIQLSVYTKTNLALAWVYIAQPGHYTNGLKPSRKYLRHLLEAKDILSKEYYHNLHETPTCIKQP